MSVITVERIKLFSTRSPWWCMIVAAVLTVGFAALTTGFLNASLQRYPIGAAVADSRPDTDRLNHRLDV